MCTQIPSCSMYAVMNSIAQQCTNLCDFVPLQKEKHHTRTHTRTHTHACAHVHTRTRAHTHTHTHTSVAKFLRFARISSLSTVYFTICCVLSIVYTHSSTSMHSAPLILSQICVRCSLSHTIPLQDPRPLQFSACSAKRCVRPG